MNYFLQKKYDMKKIFMSELGSTIVFHKQYFDTNELCHKYNKNFKDWFLREDIQNILKTKPSFYKFNYKTYAYNFIHIEFFLIFLTWLSPELYYKLNCIILDTMFIEVNMKEQNKKNLFLKTTNQNNNVNIALNNINNMKKKSLDILKNKTILPDIMEVVDSSRSITEICANIHNILQ